MLCVWKESMCSVGVWGGEGGGRGGYNWNGIRRGEL